MESSALDTKLPPAARAVRAIIASDPDDLSSGLSSLTASFYHPWFAIYQCCLLDYRPFLPPTVAHVSVSQLLCTHM